MIEFRDAAPGIDVLEPEFGRLLGYPRGWQLENRAMELAEWARDWFARHARPWVYARQAASIEARVDGVVIDGVRFAGARLRRTLETAGAHGAVLVAVSAGPEVEQEAQARWGDGKPDEYFFLETYGSAVVEHLMTAAGARLCAWADADGSAVLPHDSPGYPEWPVDEQRSLLEVIARGCPDAMPLDAMESGMLRPKKSQLAVFGLTRHVDRVRRLTDLNPCQGCSYSPCRYRRAPCRREMPASETRPPASMQDVNGSLPPPLDSKVRYSVGLKALQRWSGERLMIAPQADGTVEAVFRYEGTTCTNMGRPLHFEYHVTLGPREEGHRILAQRCLPAAADDGHRFMCEYLKEGERLMASIAAERPLGGQCLDDVVRWRRPSSPAGCYCDADSRQHKWGLALETIHYALARRLERPAMPVAQGRERP